MNRLSISAIRHDARMVRVRKKRSTVSSSRFATGCLTEASNCSLLHAIRRRAAGLEHAQKNFAVPVIGAVEPGARAAARATKNRRVGVIATKGTVESECYPRAIRHIDAGITVFSTATPKFVDIVEQGIRMSKGPIEDLTSRASKVYIRPAFQEIAQDYLEPLRRCDIDTLVLGCTHYPMLKALIGGVVGHGVLLVSSAEEMAKDVRETLTLRGQLASPDNVATREFFTSSDEVEEFQSFGSRVFNREICRPTHIDLSCLEKYDSALCESRLQDASDIQ